MPEKCRRQFSRSNAAAVVADSNQTHTSPAKLYHYGGGRRLSHSLPAPSQRWQAALLPLRRQSCPLHEGLAAGYGAWILLLSLLRPVHIRPGVCLSGIFCRCTQILELCSPGSVRAGTPPQQESLQWKPEWIQMSPAPCSPHLHRIPYREGNRLPPRASPFL